MKREKLAYQDPRKSPFYTLAIVILIGAGLAFVAFFVLAVLAALESFR